MKKTNMKNIITIGAIVMGIGVATPAVAEAATVYYQGYAVSWNHGRSLGVTSYSTVQTGRFTHSATANTTFSGWKNPGVEAHAQQWIGTGAATAYWNCK